MKIKTPNNNLNFKGWYNNKAVLKTLETISDHSASFTAGVSFASALFLRPLAISLTPHTDKENKKILTSESISSALAKFAIVEAIALPIEKSIKNINKNPDNYLKKETIKRFKGAAQSLPKSREYKFATQIIKSGANLLSAAPKSIIGVALIPIVNDFLFNKKTVFKKQKNDSPLKETKARNDSLFSKTDTKTSFTGLSKFVAKVIDSKKMQEFAISHVENDKNIVRNVSSLTDVFLTMGSVLGVGASKKIDSKKKKSLIASKVLSSAISIFAGCTIDKMIQKGTNNTIKQLKLVHKNNPKLLKYIEGINVLRPTLIFASIYYGVIPVVATFVSDKISNQKHKVSV